jgi:hypothetical protein
LEAAFSFPVGIIAGPQVGILYTVNSIPIKLCFITEQNATRNPAMYKHSLAKFNSGRNHSVEEPAHVANYKYTNRHHVWFAMPSIRIE